MGSTDPDPASDATTAAPSAPGPASAEPAAGDRLSPLTTLGAAWALLGLGLGAVAGHAAGMLGLAIGLTVVMVIGVLVLLAVVQRRLRELERREARLPQATALDDLERRLEQRRARLEEIEPELREAERVRERKAEAERYLEENEPRVRELAAQRERQQTLEAELERLQQETARERERSTALAREVSGLEGRRDEAERRAADLERREADARERLETTRGELEALEQRHARLTAEVADLDDQRASRDRAVSEAADRAAERDEAARTRDARHAEAERLREEAEAAGKRLEETREAAEELEARRSELRRETADLEAQAERHRRLEKELGEMTDRRAALSEQVAAAQARESALETRLATLRAEVEQQESRVSEMREETRSLTEQRNALRAEAAELEPAAERRAELKRSVEGLERQERELSRTTAAQKREEAEKQQRCRELGERLESEGARLERIERELADLRERHAALSAEAAESERLRDRRDAHASELGAQAERTRGELESLRAEAEKRRAERRELLEEVEGLAARKSQTEATIATLDETLKEMRLQQGYRGSNTGPLSELWKPALRADAFDAPGEAEEDAWLRAMRGRLAHCGLRYADRLLRAFHTAMKVQDQSPLCVLAGLSGTGKTELARRYAEGMGMHFLNIAVQPRWDDPQDLFGFFNYLENQYRATELSRALIQMDPFAGEAGRGWDLPEGWDHGLSNRMLVVLLDEMNLAHVEYYFSEFLSRLELRRGIDKTDPADRRQAELVLEIGAHGASDPTLRLFVDTNVLFVGTVNEDETTRALSDKVVDRANTLSFGAPQALHATGGPAEDARPRTYLPFDAWRGWIRGPRDLEPEMAAETDRGIDRINEALSRVHRPLGYRTYGAIRAYAANYPERGEEGLRHALADQLEQKILPKFRGMDPTEGAVSEALERVVELAEGFGDRSLVEAIERSREEGARQYHFHFLGVDRSAEAASVSPADPAAATEHDPGGDG